MQISRRAFIASLLGIPFLGASAAGYMRFWEPEHLEITEKNARIGGLKNKIRILHLSDFHASEAVSYDYIESAVHSSLSCHPDLVFLTGDFITWTLEQEERYAEILSQLSQKHPTFACIGNHDGGRWAGSSHGYPTFDRVQQLLEKSGITLLFNQSASVKIKNQSLDVIGLGDLWSNDAKPEIFLSRKRTQERPVLLLCHNPDTKEIVKHYDWDIMFSGHTHGGQLVIPWLGTRPFLPIKDKLYAEGLLPFEGKWIHVTRGIGNLHGLRFNCRPEISIVTLS